MYVEQLENDNQSINQSVSRLASEKESLVKQLTVAKEQVNIQPHLMIPSFKQSSNHINKTLSMQTIDNPANHPLAHVYASELFLTFIICVQWNCFVGPFVCRLTDSY